MKKLLAVLLSVLMLVSCCVMSVAADDIIFNDAELNWGDNDGIFNDAELDWSAFKGSFTVGSADVKPGDTFTVPVSIEVNPGIVSLKLAVAYDADMLELVEAAAGDFVVAEQENVTVASPSFGPIENNPFIINWVDALAAENNTATGVIANLTFKVKEDAEGTTDITITFNPNDVFDYDMNNVEFGCTAGTVTVKSYIPGDVDGDGKVNVRDLGRLQQYLNGWDVEIDLAAANVTGDSTVNVRDLGLLQQYLNGFDVTLK